MALQENIAKYEQEFGRIQLPNRQPRTISPFNINNKGEAWRLKKHQIKGPNRHENEDSALNLC